MSDISTSIVPELTSYPDRQETAQKIVNWLVSIKAIKSVKTDCTLSSESGYPIDSGAEALTREPDYLPFDVIVNGLQVITQPTVFDAGENGLDSVVCQQCNEDIIAEQWSLKEYVETGNSLLRCPLCKQSSDLNQYLFEPAWGFSNLGFTFWNWTELTDEFIKAFEQQLGCKVKVVESHI